MEHYLFLCSEDSLNYHASNNALDFTIELDKELVLDGEWKVGLLDVACEVKEAQFVIICCDLCCPSFASDQYIPVLRTLYVKKGKNNRVFTLPYYIRTHLSSVKRLRVYITGWEGEPKLFTSKPLRCTLHLKAQ